MNRMPTFSTSPPQPVVPDQINPYKAASFVRGTPLKRGDPDSKAALKNMVERINERNRR